MSDAEENRVVHRPPVPQQGFFPDPLAPDPTIYHIREVTSKQVRKRSWKYTASQHTLQWI